MSTYSKSHICQCLTRISTVRRNSTVMISGSRRKTGEQFSQAVLSLARGLSELGIRNGHVVAISAFNSDLYLEWLLAVTFVGGIVAPLNYRWSFQEAKSAMLAVRPVMLVSDASCSHWYSELRDEAFPFLMWKVFIDSTFPRSIKLSNALTTESLRKHSVRALELNYTWAPDGAAIVCFTSGTTGRPKGVVVSHSALTVQSLAKVAIVGYCDDDVYLHLAPLCHIGGLSSALAMLMVGGCHILIPKFEVAIAVDIMEKHNVTSFITVPTILVDLISFINFQTVKLKLLFRMKENWKEKHSINKILNGGGSLTAEMIEQVATYLPQTKLFSAYGMTETSSSLTFMTLYNPSFQTSHQVMQISGGTEPNSTQVLQGICVGKPAPHVELSVRMHGSSTSGIILTRGPHVMVGYWDQYTAKELQSTNDIWLDTGDVGSLDQSGNLWLLGRMNDRIKSGGENVYPTEIEAVLLQHPGVIRAVVVGIPDARLGEQVVGCIQLRESWQWSDRCHGRQDESKEELCSETLKKHCRGKNLTGFKVPRKFIWWRDHFPCTSTGKIIRDQVRSEVMIHRFQSISSNL
ncbi:2-succinylbenzoate--CoA ligase, chloroplastic/peroxisomal [Linum perenne]